MSIVQMGLLAAISAPFALSIWIAYARRPMVIAEEDGASEGFAQSRSGFAAETLMLEPAVRVAARALQREARANFVQVELAIDPWIKAHVDPNVLGTALRVTMLAAIRATPGGQVLVTGMTLGGQPHIRVTDDGKDTDQLTREGLIRGVGEMIALQGGFVGVEVRPGRATTVTIRLPSAGDRSGAFDETPAMADQAA
jgi:hypothetical protein